MIKIKTFMYEGSQYGDPNASKIDEEINNFTKKHAVISVTPVTFIKRFDPSMTKSVLVYTIVYEEAK